MCHRLLFVLLAKKHSMLGKVRQSSVCLPTTGRVENNRIIVWYSVYSFSLLIEKLIWKPVVLVLVGTELTFFSVTGTVYFGLV